MRKNVLITAGSTMTPIDKVRGITNIFSGRTGANIAEFMVRRGFGVTLLTSNPSLTKMDPDKINVVKFKTYDQLAKAMEQRIKGGDYDIVINSAAISDYKVKDVHVMDDQDRLVVVDSSKKISSKKDSLFMELVPTVKLIDQIRSPWGFTGKVVKFKLEVGITDEELIEIAKQSRADSDADLIVANCLEWAGYYAYIINKAGMVRKVSRRRLAEEMCRELD